MRPPRAMPAILLLGAALLAGSYGLKSALARTTPSTVREPINVPFALRAARLLFLDRRVAASQFFQFQASVYMTRLEFPHYHLAHEEDGDADGPHHDHDKDGHVHTPACAHEHGHAHPTRLPSGEPVAAWTHGTFGEDIPLTASQLEELRRREIHLSENTHEFIDVEYFYALIDLAATLDPGNYFVLAYGRAWVLNAAMARQMVRVLDHAHGRTGGWRPAFDAGWILLYSLRDYEAARARLALALRDPAAPRFVKDVLNKSFFADRKFEAAITQIQAQLRETDDHEVASRLERQLEWYTDLLRLNRAAFAFRQRHGRALERLDDLVAAGLLARIPEDKVGQGYAWDADRGEVFSRNLFIPVMD